VRPNEVERNFKCENSNANYPNRPSQNEYRKRAVSSAECGVRNAQQVRPVCECAVRFRAACQSAGLAHSMTLRVRRAAPNSRQVLDCDSPLPLFHRSSIPKRFQEMSRYKYGIRIAKYGMRHESVFGVAAFGRKPPFEFHVEVCGALPRRRYARISTRPVRPFPIWNSDCGMWNLWDTLLRVRADRQVGPTAAPWARHLCRSFPQTSSSSVRSGIFRCRSAGTLSGWNCRDHFNFGFKGATSALNPAFSPRRR
jgi:hypothetical protein